jgi:DNA-binding transcriptional regulator YhcF (GntR family)
MEGWIKLHRQIMENEFYFSEKFTKTQAWIDLLLLSTHKERTVCLRGIEIILKPGQLCYSQKSLAARWNWNVKTVERYLNSLKKREMVETKKTNITTIISIKKWFLYQVDGEQNTYQKGEQKDTKRETNKNGKNILIESASSLIESVNKESSLYSILAKYKNSLGEDRVNQILTDLIKNNKRFDNENRLAAYLETCKKSNGQLTDALPDLTEETLPWM